MAYDKSDCVGAIQLAAWMTGQQVTELTTTQYQNTGIAPSITTLINRFDSWSDAKEIASNTPQEIPSHVPDYYRAVAALRRASDIGGHPVTGLKYQTRLDTGVSYREVNSHFTTWTRAKIVAGVHTPGEEPWDGITPVTPSSKD